MKDPVNGNKVTLLNIWKGHENMSALTYFIFNWHWFHIEKAKTMGLLQPFENLGKKERTGVQQQRQMNIWREHFELSILKYNQADVLDTLYLQQILNFISSGWSIFSIAFFWRYILSQLWTKRHSPHKLNEHWVPQWVSSLHQCPIEKLENC